MIAGDTAGDTKGAQFMPSHTVKRLRKGLVERPGVLARPHQAYWRLVPRHSFVDCGKTDASYQGTPSQAVEKVRLRVEQRFQRYIRALI